MSDNELDLIASIAALKAVAMGLLVAQATLVAGDDEDRKREYLEDLRDGILRSVTGHDPTDLGLSSSIAQRMNAQIAVMFDSIVVGGSHQGTA